MNNIFILNWNYFYIFAIISTIMLFFGAFFAAKSHTLSRKAIMFSVIGLVVLSVFIAALWIELERPILKTMGETRLWYSFFMIISGLLTYIRWKYRWILSFTSIMAVVFMAINIFKPEIHDKTLMPALQSVWFIPHVTIYMFSYAILACSTLLAIAGLRRHNIQYLHNIDNLVSIGLSMLTIGMLLGSLWAKEAWGGYWSWDPKETWAAITWFGYIAYLHIRLYGNRYTKTAYVIIIISFATLQMCWYGVNYLPAAKQSVHTYNRI